MKKLILMMVLGMILTGCNGGDSGTVVGTTSGPVTTFTGPQYGGHQVFIATESSIAAYIPDASTGDLKIASSTPMSNNGGTESVACALRMSPKGNYLFAACNARGVFYQLTPEADGIFTESDIVAQNPGNQISTNYNPDALAFDSSGNLFVHYTENITPFTQKTAKLSFNESTNTLAFVGYVTSGIPDMTLTESVDLKDLSYVINGAQGRVDMYQDGSLTSYSVFLSAGSIAIQ